MIIEFSHFSLNTLVNAGDPQETPKDLKNKDKDGLLPRSEYMEIGCRGVSIYIIQFLHAGIISLTPPRARH